MLTTVYDLLKRYKTIIKVIFVVLFGFWIYTQIQHYQDNITAQEKVEGPIKYTYLVFVIVLVPLNWYLEALKWRRLCKPYILISIKTSLQAVLSGVTLGLVTPGRIGDYAGRMLITPILNKSLVVASTFVGSVAQNLCNIGLGLVLSLPLIDTILETKYVSSEIFYTVIVIQVLVLAFIYLRMHLLFKIVISWLSKTRFKKFSSDLYSLGVYNKGDLWYVLGISFLRYLLYFAQYSLTMQAFDQTISVINLISAVSAIYLIQSVLPLPAFISLLARGELAVLVWSTFGIGPVVALSATFSLWVSNLILPALVGLYYLVKNDYWSFQRKNKTS